MEGVLTHSSYFSESEFLLSLHLKCSYAESMVLSFLEFFKLLRNWNHKSFAISTIKRLKSE